ncbi:EAL domain-containing protein [Paracoccus onubensis]|uniref:putative bifunctional diguanylate cyclase/phosphodiesterase n=1 Tax=Paracoccus onubensis TaxID=1675788 RepID=UPI00272F5F26|nr:EAL domain-containing protein [Paracoccus onubensis]MDP0928750.1 EAL domain-containing protein [Paracoccus onubensis]
MIDNIPLAVMTVDPVTYKIDYVNKTSKELVRSIEHLLPIKTDDLVGSSIDVFHENPERQRQILRDPANLPFNARISLGPELLDLKISAITADDGSFLGPMLTWAIVTQKVAAKEKIRQLAHYDTLTGLANRTTFNERLKERLNASDDGPGLLYIDLDGFKLVNDTRGHNIGDELLKCVAEKLRNLGEDEDITIGRLGGDEFAILVPYNDPARMEAFASRVIAELSSPRSIEYHRKIHISASIGIAYAPAHGTTGEELQKNADIALYAAKKAGKRCYRMFSEKMRIDMYERLRLQERLSSALRDNRNIFLYYQPIIDVKTGQTMGREALIRWYQPDRGWVSPTDFIPVAENSDLIDRLGEFVLTKACCDAADWDDGLPVAVNVSAAQLGRDTLTSMVRAALAKSGLSHDRLEIEVTETAVLNNEAGAIRDLLQIRDLGVRVALDDFGTGFSSLTHLLSFPFDKIKIDGSFVQDAVQRKKAAAIVGAIAGLGARLGVTTVAEGVETQDQLRLVVREGCKAIQGFHTGRPAPMANDAHVIAALTGKTPASIITDIKGPSSLHPH